ncbi:MAG: transcriptional regulator NrdR [Planctomycetota bacterium]
MKCPFCKNNKDAVVDSRLAENGFAMRRRRRCLNCNRRYTTYERREESSLKVEKKDGSLEPFKREKIKDGVNKACEKRPVSLEKMEEIVSGIEREAYDKYDGSVPSRKIGELVMRELKKVDQVAYVRFASVYRQFKDIQEFFKELKPMLKK